MAPTKKSIYRQPGAQHFQLVHRSVRDPLINDPEASQQVFKQVERANDARKTGYTLAELENTIDKNAIRANEGEAALYGITYDDSSYDYMSHLRQVGQGGFDSVLLAAPRGSGVAHGMKAIGKGKGKAREDDLFTLPDDVLPSKDELSVQQAHASQQAIPPELQGFQPDMDPHLRQVLEALEDDAFVEDDGDEDLFGELLGGGELEDGEEGEEFEFHEWGLAGSDEGRTENGDGAAGGGEDAWMDRYRAFKAAGGKPQVAAAPEDASEFDEAERSEMADTIGSLASNLGDMMVVGGKKRRGKRGPSDATGMSMSSSSMWRNDQLRTLDDQFDQYEMEDDDDDFPDDDDDDVSIAPSFASTASRVSLFSGAPSSPPTISRDDFDAIMDDFLDNYEVVGRRMRESLGGNALSGPEKLQVLRHAIESGDEGLNKEENRARILAIEAAARSGVAKEKRQKLPMRDVTGDKEDKWDVETILTTFTNTENHPGMIRSRTAAQVKARAEARAGREAAATPTLSERGPTAEDDDEDDSGSETERDEPRTTVTRPKGETAEERKARKAAVKAERSARRVEKKQHKETFGTERKRHLVSQQKMVANGRAADLSVASARGVVSLR